MQKISYVNGAYVPHHLAAVHIEDRGYQFSDGIYEVIAIENGHFIDGSPHLDRLERSLAALEISTPMSRRAMQVVIRELLRKNHSNHGCLYIQITRGVAKRNHEFPKSTPPAIVMTLSGPKTPSNKQRTEGVAAITYPDIRWGRRDIKSISLLPNILAKEQAARAHVREAWLHDTDGIITEGSSSNSYIVTQQGVIITHPANERILGGITRHTVLTLAKKKGFQIEERPFSIKEIEIAKEAFLTSTTSEVLPVVKIDNIIIGNGHPQEITQKLMQLYDSYRSTQNSLIIT